MARLGEVPFGPSYGSVDATPLWLILLGEANDWLADPVLVDRLWPAALRALAWLDARLALDQGQFLRYAGRPGALANEGWKDSPDAVRDRVGATVPAPIALAEVQGYLYDAWRRLARLARERGEAPLAIGLDRRASRLRVRFRDAFWISDRSFPAMALGRQDRVADSIASNAGQCLWSGILTASTATAVARRILADDMDSGWGIRTLAAGEPAFDPRGYHTGSVWPHDTALIAGGLKRAGFDAAAIKLADQLFEAALAVPASRLPELLSGEARVRGAGPGLVAGACPVQAWASAAPLHLVRSLLGLEPDARAARLVLRRPRLPGAVDRIRIRGLSVGARRLDLEVSRSRSGVRAAQIGGDPAIRLVRLG
jgi:glycogen debranching enzyme